MITAREAREGRHEYSCNCGWIDWGHAAGDREDMVGLWLQFPIPSADRSRLIATGVTKSPQRAYARRLPDFARISGWSVVSRSTGKAAGFLPELAWFVPDQRELVQYKRIALAIFQVSCGLYEALQTTADVFAAGVRAATGGLVDIPTGRSGFSFEDLVSNHLAFHQVVDGFKDADVRRLCRSINPSPTATGPSEALAAELERAGRNAGTNPRWFQPILFNDVCKECAGVAGGLPTDFRTITPAVLGTFPNSMTDAWFDRELTDAINLRRKTQAVAHGATGFLKGHGLPLPSHLLNELSPTGPGGGRGEEPGPWK